MIPLILSLVGLVLIGCGGTTNTGASRVFDDGSISAGGSGGASASDGDSSDIVDADTFACGPTRCAANEICVYPPCGCIVETAPRTDAGTCPAGFEPEGDGGTCYVPPGCPRYPPSCATWDGGSYMCSGQDGTLSGFITAPVPIGSSHVCYDSCV